MNTGPASYNLLGMEAIAISSTILISIDILVVEELGKQTDQQRPNNTKRVDLP